MPPPGGEQKKTMPILGAFVLFLLIFWQVDGLLAFVVVCLLLVMASPLLFMGLIFGIFAVLRAVWRFFRRPKG